jgi:hypothetical protein
MEIVWIGGRQSGHFAEMQDMQFVGLFVLIILAGLFLNSIQGCSREPLDTTCYMTGMRLTTAEYICPVCGYKTLYDKDRTAWVVKEIVGYRRGFDQLNRVSPLKMTLDESSLCAQCSPNATEHQVGLTVTHGDGTSQTTSPVSWNDLSILREYFEGHLTDYTPNMTPGMIRENTFRIGQLLGRDIPSPEQK